MLLITKKFEFECSHLLNNHKGACRNLHGHSYKLEVTIAGEPIVDISHPAYGMLIDFKDLKRIVDIYIIDQFDHAYVYNSNIGKCSASHRVAEVCELFDMKRVCMYNEPTCENMAKLFFTMLDDAFNKHQIFNFKLYKIKLYETAGSFAEYVRPEVIPNA